MEMLAKVFEFLKLPLRFIAFFALMTGLLLFLPDGVIQKLALRLNFFFPHPPFLIRRFQN